MGSELVELGPGHVFTGQKDRYVIVRTIGHGSEGRVYLAQAHQ